MKSCKKQSDGKRRSSSFSVVMATMQLHHTFPVSHVLYRLDPGHKSYLLTTAAISNRPIRTHLHGTCAPGCVGPYLKQPRLAGCSLTPLPGGAPLVDHHRVPPEEAHEVRRFLALDHSHLETHKLDQISPTYIKHTYLFFCLYL